MGEDETNEKIEQYYDIFIWYAPPPDGEDCSSTYASRASKLLLDHFGKSARVVLLEQLDPEHEILLELVKPRNLKDEELRSTSATNNDNSNKIHIFLISCAADGSVHRSVRKLMRKCPATKNKNEETDSNDTTLNESTTKEQQQNKFIVATALLGHARCETSATQMDDTIFGTGRRFDKGLKQFLEGTASGSSASKIFLFHRILEDQVELRGPEVAFDPWIKDIFPVEAPGG